jgi:hypothetical protein
MLLGRKRAWHQYGQIGKTFETFIIRGEFVRKERRKNSTTERLQAYGALGEKLEN